MKAYTVNNALHTLAGQIFEAGLSGAVNLERQLWARADRIESRYRCAGLCQAKVDRLIARRNQFLTAQSSSHDEVRPSRKSFLHR